MWYHAKFQGPGGRIWPRVVHLFNELRRLGEYDKIAKVFTSGSYDSDDYTVVVLYWSPKPID